MQFGALPSSGPPNTPYATINRVAVGPNGNITVAEDSGAFSGQWATNISAGPNEATQTLTFIVTNDNPTMFAVQPAMSATGVLTFTPAPDAFSTATVTVRLQDKTKKNYEYRASFFLLDGTSKSIGPITTNDSILLLEMPAAAAPGA